MAGRIYHAAIQFALRLAIRFGCRPARGLATLLGVLAGMEFSIVLRHAGLQTASNVVFGGIGALGVPAVLRKLRAFGAIEPF